MQERQRRLYRLPLLCARRLEGRQQAPSLALGIALTRVGVHAVGHADQADPPVGRVDRAAGQAATLEAIDDARHRAVAEPELAAEVFQRQRPAIEQHAQRRDLRHRQAALAHGRVLRLLDVPPHLAQQPADFRRVRQQLGVRRSRSWSCLGHSKSMSHATDARRSWYRVVYDASYTTY